MTQQDFLHNHMSSIVPLDFITIKARVGRRLSGHALELRKAVLIKTFEQNMPFGQYLIDAPRTAIPQITLQAPVSVQKPAKRPEPDSSMSALIRRKSDEDMSSERRHALSVNMCALLARRHSVV